MNNEKLLQELQELNLLWTGLSHIPNFPKELLELSRNKLENINLLLKQVKEASNHDNMGIVVEDQSTSENEPVIAPAPDMKSTTNDVFIPEMIQESLLEERNSINQPSPKSAPKLPKQQSDKPESLVDRYEKNRSRESLQKKLESKQFADLSKGLSLNDRFRFKRDLFGNSAEKMSQALQEINRMQNMNEAMNYLQLNYAEYDKTESFTDFCILLENHFSC